MLRFAMDLLFHKDILIYLKFQNNEQLEMESEVVKLELNTSALSYHQYFMVSTFPIKAA